MPWIYLTVAGLLMDRRQSPGVPIPIEAVE